ncbi:Uncharacterised protein [Vibrio cholerae]|nr:Uncharacterised protein [Vibrio cholerae]
MCHLYYMYRLSPEFFQLFFHATNVITFRNQSAKPKHLLRELLAFYRHFTNESRFSSWTP